MTQKFTPPPFQTYAATLAKVIALTLLALPPASAQYWYCNCTWAGFGTTSPIDHLHVQFTDSSGVTTGYAVQNLSSTGFSGMLFYDQNTALGLFQGFSNSTHEYRINNIASSGTINFLIGSSSKFYVANNGNVGINTTSPGHQLGVNGTIGATEVVVVSSGADYVFDPGYRLKPLGEVSEYIRENHHLPEIPSAKEVQEKGVSLGEMQTKLLAKIEELTLHMIESEEQSKRLEQENRDLKERVGRLEVGNDH